MTAAQTDLSGRSIVVTGGSGFIGGHLISALVSYGARVTNLDIAPPAVAEQRACWKALDLMDADQVALLVEQACPDIIFNLAAHAKLEGGRAAMAVNVLGLGNLLDAAKRLSAPPLIVHASTQLVAGVLPEDFDPLEHEPYGDYGASKAESEMLLRAKYPDDRWVIVRPSNIWGPHHPSFANNIWKYLKLGLYLHPRGVSVVRSYGFVENVVTQLVAILTKPPSEVCGRVFYVGDEPIDSALWLDGFSVALRGRPVRRMPVGPLAALARAGDFSAKLGGPSPINTGRLGRMTSDFAVPMRSTFEVLGRGTVSLHEGIAKTVQWLDDRDEAAHRSGTPRPSTSSG